MRERIDKEVEIKNKRNIGKEREQTPIEMSSSPLF